MNNVISTFCVVKISNLFLCYVLYQYNIKYFKMNVKFYKYSLNCYIKLFQVQKTSQTLLFKGTLRYVGFMLCHVLKILFRLVYFFCGILNYLHVFSERSEYRIQDNNFSGCRVNSTYYVENCYFSRKYKINKKISIK